MSVKTIDGMWSRYKKLIKRPGQVDGRERLRAAVHEAAAALTQMWDSDYADYRASMPGMDGKYKYAMYYFQKYLIEMPEFDTVADETINQPVYMVFMRGDGSIGWSGNGAPSAIDNGTALAYLGLLAIIGHPNWLIRMVGKMMRRLCGEYLIKIGTWKRGPGKA